MEIKRSSGILLHISSLPGNYGIGTLGAEAYQFAQQLQKGGQSYWQILPFGPVSPCFLNIHPMLQSQRLRGIRF